MKHVSHPSLSLCLSLKYKYIYNCLVHTQKGCIEVTSWDHYAINQSIDITLSEGPDLG